MQTSHAFVLCVALGLAAGACDDDADDAQPDDAPPSVPNDTKAIRAACTCGGKGSTENTSQVSLECVCELTTCHDFESYVAKQNQHCGEVAEVDAVIKRGCGYTIIDSGYDFVGGDVVYRGPEHEIVAASTFSDTPWGPCQTGEYTSKFPSIEDCPDYTACSLCQYGSFELCPESTVGHDGEDAGR